MSDPRRIDLEQLFEGVTHYRDGSPRPPRGQRRGEAGICTRCNGVRRVVDGVATCGTPRCDDPVQVRAERVDEPVRLTAIEYATMPRWHKPGCPGARERYMLCECPSADNQPYVNSWTTGDHQAEVEGDPFPADEDFAETDLAEFYEALRPTGPLDEIVRDVKRRMDVADHRPPPIEAEVLGVDYRTATAARLGGDAGRLAALHYPFFGRPPSCAGCDGAPGRDPGDATWPCTTAKLALEMMGLTAIDIAITDK